MSIPHLSKRRERAHQYRIKTSTDCINRVQLVRNYNLFEYDFDLDFDITTTDALDYNDKFKNFYQILTTYLQSVHAVSTHIAEDNHEDIEEYFPVPTDASARLSIPTVCDTQHQRYVEVTLPSSLQTDSEISSLQIEYQDSSPVDTSTCYLEHDIKLHDSYYPKTPSPHEVCNTIDTSPEIQEDNDSCEDNSLIKDSRFKTYSTKEENPLLDVDIGRQTPENVNDTSHQSYWYVRQSYEHQRTLPLIDNSGSRVNNTLTHGYYQRKTCLEELHHRILYPQLPRLPSLNCNRHSCIHKLQIFQKIYANANRDIFKHICYLSSTRKTFSSKPDRDINCSLYKVILKPPLRRQQPNSANTAKS